MRGYTKQNLIFIVLILLTGIIAVHCENSADFGEKTREQESHLEPLPEYTEKQAREWEPIKQDHLPQIWITEESGDEYLRIFVPLKDPSPSHYIEKVGLMNQKGKTLFVKEFGRSPGKYDVKFKLQNEWDIATSRVFVKCNLHDLWTVSELERFKK